MRMSPKNKTSGASFVSKLKKTWMKQGLEVVDIDSLARVPLNRETRSFLVEASTPMREVLLEIEVRKMQTKREFGINSPEKMSWFILHHLPPMLLLLSLPSACF